MSGSRRLSQATFKPKINPPKGKPTATPPGSESAEAVYDRLYASAIRSDRLRKEVLTRIKIQEELSGCTFAPQVCGRTGLPVIFECAGHLRRVSICRHAPVTTDLLCRRAGEPCRIVWHQRVCVPPSVQARAAPGTLAAHFIVLVWALSSLYSFLSLCVSLCWRGVAARAAAVAGGSASSVDRIAAAHAVAVAAKVAITRPHHVPTTQRRQQ